eukprot:TRINITY_DN4657_c0_g1_i12.p1 TRINITY_DN4657_c0_g1~~TRINITY_DN4657_c0_g1_i12.p1  ORF type:complete len:260 (-),score=49.48 TRINITY_DN4657_c0_g1_i12:929-1708(-)
MTHTSQANVVINEVDNVLGKSKQWYQRRVREPKIATMTLFVLFLCLAILLFVVYRSSLFLKIIPESFLPLVLYYRSPIPGPRPSLGVGNVKQWKPGKMHEKLLEWVNLYGDIYQFFMGTKQVVLIADPKYIHHILRKYPKNPPQAFIDLVGDRSILTTRDLQFHDSLRKSVQPLFVTSYLREMEPFIVSQACFLVEELKTTDGVVDMAEWFELLLLDIITCTTFGQNNVNFMQNKNHPMRDAVNQGLLCVMDRIVNPWR